MRNFTLLALLFSAGCFSQTYITNVTIADVEKKKLVPNQTVIIEGDKISDVRSGTVKIPQNAIVIDGKGKYLLPGMTDAHVHFFQNGGLYTRPDAIDLRELKPYPKEIADARRLMGSQLKRYLRNGITNVIDPGATNNFLKHRLAFKDKTFAPSIYMSGPLLTTYLPEVYKDMKDDSPFTLVLTPEEARNAVRAQLGHQPDFLKIWYIANVDGLGAEAGARKYLAVIQAAIDEAHKNNIKVAVHATERLTAQLSVESGCDYLVHGVEDELLSDDFVKLVKAKKVILCPTLLAHAGYMDTFGQKLNISTHELRQADPFQLGSLIDLKHVKIADSTMISDYFKSVNAEKSVAKMREETEIIHKNLKKLSDAGVTIASGTDAGNIGTLHASSYLDELLEMHKAGLSNWQIIEASTINGAKVLGKQSEFGSIAKGKKANLIVLDANPVDDIQNITKINRVINKGIVFDPEKILEETPEELIQRQLNAYNFRNIEAFLDTYSDDVEVYLFPDKLEYKGKQKMRAIYGSMFEKTPNLHCEILGRIVDNNIIIDKESVRFNDKTMQGTAIYVVEKGKISKVYFTP